MILIKNKKAFFDYEILSSYEAGIELFGYEVKSLRHKNANLKGSFVIIRNGEVFLKQMHIAAWKTVVPSMVDTLRERKLFLKKKDIENLTGKIQEAGYTLIVTQIYTKDHLIKAGVALARGKKSYQKKQTLKEKDIKKQSDMILKKYY